MSCPNCNGLRFTLRKIGQDTFATRCNLCRPGSLFMVNEKMNKYVVIGPSIAYLPLSQGKFALIDADDAGWIGQWNWYAMWNRLTKSFYAARHESRTVNPKRPMIRMNRLILGLQTGDKLKADHINLNTLDNRRSNLRPATHGQNKCNAVKHRDNTSGYKGVTRNTDGREKEWRAQINIDGKHKSLGDFYTPEDAYAAYCASAQEHHGEFARTA